MKVFRKGLGLKKIKNPILTLGNFDGVHLGHRKILKTVSGKAKRLNCPSVVYSFEPHPLKVIAPHKSPPLILDSETKTSLIAGLGIDYLVLARFTREFAAKHPREFVKEALVPMSVREIWVGRDFSFGRGGAGTVGYLEKLGKEFGFRVYAVQAYKKGGKVVSSSRIRELIAGGMVDRAAGLLARPYSIKGRVVKGRNIGRRLGFPTANLRVKSELVPGNGVYAAYAFLDGKRYRSVINIGVAPTFGAKKRCVEAHLLGFKDDIYGRDIEVSFIKRLRPEKAFKSKEALAGRIRKDIEKAKRFF